MTSLVNQFSRWDSILSTFWGVERTVRPSLPAQRTSEGRKLCVPSITVSPTGSVVFIQCILAVQQIFVK